jgi:hypothetical protein
MWVATFAVMADRTADRGFDIGFSGFRNGGFPGGAALHPELNHALLDIDARFFCARQEELALSLKDYTTNYNPAAGRGMRGERLLYLANRVAMEELESGLSSWPIALKCDWEKREQQREWDFLVAVYGEQQANLMAVMHPLDMQAFSLYIRGYDMWTCEFTGDMKAVLGVLEKATPENQAYSLVDQMNMMTMSTLRDGTSAPPSTPSSAAPSASPPTSPSAAPSASPSALPPMSPSAAPSAVHKPVCSPSMAFLTVTVMDGFPGDQGCLPTRELCRVSVPITATVADLYKKVDPLVDESRVLSYMMRPLDYMNGQNGETLASLGLVEDTTLRIY